MSTARLLPPPILDKLEKLLLMCSSAHAGERAAATAAIDRLLKSNSADWHDLTALINRAAAPAPAAAPARSSSSSPASSWRRTEGPQELRREQLTALIDIIEEHHPFLTVKASEFVSSLRQKTRLWPTVKLSAKQWKWLICLWEPECER
jgi:hypothetical protein